MTANAWCPECRKTQPVVEAYTEDTGDSRVNVEVYWVTHFECGHQSSVLQQTYPSPLQQEGLPRSASLPDPFGDER